MSALFVNHILVHRQDRLSDLRVWYGLKPEKTNYNQSMNINKQKEEETREREEGEGRRKGK